jgi:hypothetical protein
MQLHSAVYCWIKQRISNNATVQETTAHDSLYTSGSYVGWLRINSKPRPGRLLHPASVWLMTPQIITRNTMHNKDICLSEQRASVMESSTGKLDRPITSAAGRSGRTGIALGRWVLSSWPAVGHHLPAAGTGPRFTATRLPRDKSFLQEGGG